MEPAPDHCQIGDEPRRDKKAERAATSVAALSAFFLSCSTERRAYGTGLRLVEYFALITPISSLAMSLWVAADGWTPSSVISVP